DEPGVEATGIQSRPAQSPEPDADTQGRGDLSPQKIEFSGQGASDLSLSSP
ncbi:unnamed protein product, partial [marine sediment metagenome]